MRSLSPKINNFKIEMIEREINIALLSEIWEKDACKKQKYEFQKMLQVEGLKYISTPRKGKRVGGLQLLPI